MDDGSINGVGGVAHCHQRVIRDDMARVDPRDVRPNLDGYAVETISRLEAEKIILHYEWLGNIGKSHTFVGLIAPDRTVEGVACFGYGPAGQIRGLIGDPALCLERGACVHYAPKNAASFLVTAACKLVFRLTGVPIFFAYADPMAGEHGGVYQACGWAYLGQGLDGRKGRRRRYSVLPPGLDPNRPENWKSTRELRRGTRNMSFDEARAAGWQIATREAKHVYATNVGPTRRKWRKNLVCPPYPSPRPELKINKANASTSEDPERARSVSPMRIEREIIRPQAAFAF
jgi:hypothetical protein